MSTNLVREADRYHALDSPLPDVLHTLALDCNFSFPKHPNEIFGIVCEDTLRSHAPSRAKPRAAP